MSDLHSSVDDSRYKKIIKFIIIIVINFIYMMVDRSVHRPRDTRVERKHREVRFYLLNAQGYFQSCLQKMGRVTFPDSYIVRASLMTPSLGAVHRRSSLVSEISSVAPNNIVGTE